MDEATYTQLITGSLFGELTDAEQVELDAWLAADEQNQVLFDDYRKTWQASEEADDDYQPDVAAGRARLETLLDKADAATAAQQADAPQPTGKVVRMTPMKMMLRVAAVVVLALGSWLFYQNVVLSDDVTIITAQNEEQKVDLPDGSQVWVNRNTKLSYRYKFRQYRKVELQGEAYFEVAKDTETPFVIETGSGRTTVTGTSFTVSAYPGSKSVEINVVSGSVNISSTHNEGVVETLTAGEKGLIEQATGKLVKTPVDNRNFRAWQTNQLVFENDSMQVVVESIEAYFGIEIVIQNPDLEGCRFRAVMDDPTLDKVWELFNAMNSITAVENDRVWVLDGPGCVAPSL